jgi:hypothetical protein
MSSHSTQAPRGSRGSSSRSTGRQASFQPSRKSRSTGPSRSRSVWSASPRAQLDLAVDAGRGIVPPRADDLPRFHLRGDHLATAIVAHRGGQIDRRDSERGAELDDPARAACARQLVERATLRRVDRDEGVTQIGFGGFDHASAAQQAKRGRGQRPQEDPGVAAGGAVQFGESGGDARICKAVHGVLRSGIAMRPVYEQKLA